MIVRDDENYCSGMSVTPGWLARYATPREVCKAQYRRDCSQENGFETERRGHFSDKTNQWNKRLTQSPSIATDPASVIWSRPRCTCKKVSPVLCSPIRCSRSSVQYHSFKSISLRGRLLAQTKGSAVGVVWGSMSSDQFV